MDFKFETDKREYKADIVNDGLKYDDPILMMSFQVEAADNSASFLIGKFQGNRCYDVFIREKGRAGSFKITSKDVKSAAIDSALLCERIYDWRQN